ncbi:hypothetical protein, partial [Solemya velum gill symbiont]|uniref:hypothetical protein n=1 Tax=Solemya velum gill symbiont TaxID=2340 RepID=UPI001C4E1C47
NQSQDGIVRHVYKYNTGTRSYIIHHGNGLHDAKRHSYRKRYGTSRHCGKMVGCRRERGVDSGDLGCVR